MPGPGSTFGVPNSVLTQTFLMAGAQALGILTAPGPKRFPKEEISYNPGDAANVWPYIAGTVETVPHLISYFDFNSKKVPNDVGVEDIIASAGIQAAIGAASAAGALPGTPAGPVAVAAVIGGLTGAITTGLGQLRTASYRWYGGFAYGVCNCGGTPIDSIEQVLVDERPVAVSAAAAGGTVMLDDPMAWGGDHVNGGVKALCDIVPGLLWPQQQPNPYLVSVLGNNVPAYSGKALFIIRGASYSLDGDFSGYFAAVAEGAPSLRPLKLRVKRLPSVLGVAAFKDVSDGDANTAECIYEWLTNPSFGARKVAATKIDVASFQSVAETLFNEGLGFSDEFNSAVDVETALDIFTSHSDLILFGAFRSPGQIRLKAIRRNYSVPDLPVYRRGASSDVTDPREYNVLDREALTPGAWSSTANDYRFEYTDRLNNFQRTSRNAQDLANRMIQGRTKTLSQSLRGVSTADNAAFVGTREMRAGSFPRPPLSLLVNRAVYDGDSGDIIPNEAEPGDVIKFVDTVDGFTKVLRVAEVQQPSSEDAAIRLICIEEVYGVGAAAYGSGGTGFSNPVSTPTATGAGESVVVEAPYGLAFDDDPKLLVFASKPNGAQVSYDLYVSSDGGATYIQQGSSVDFAIKGTITEAIDRLTDDVMTNLTFTPSTAFEATRLQSATEAEVRTGVNLIYLPAAGEFMAVETPTDNGDGTYTLGNIWRAVLDSVPVPHSAGAVCWFFTYGRVVTVGEYADGTATKTKILPKTVSETLPIGSATAINLTTVGRAIRPSPVRGVTIGGNYLDEEIGAADDVVVAWKETNRLTDGEVKQQTEAGVEPEATTTYTVRWYATESGSVLLRTESGIAASTGTQTATMTLAEEAASGNYLGHYSTAYRVEIDVVRGGETSNTYVRELTRPPITGSGTFGIPQMAIASGGGAVAGGGGDFQIP